MSRSEILSAAQMALATIREHKMRSFLTILGVIIGTGTVIGVGSIITGLDSSIARIFRSMGPNTVIAFKFKIGFRFNVTREEGMRKPLTIENARAIEERCGSCKYVSPYLFPDFRTIHVAKYKGDEMYDIDMGGTEEAYAAGGTTMKAGRFISDTDNRHHLPVCVVGEDIQKAWFPDLNVVGKHIQVDGHDFEIVGAMDRPAASFPGQEDRRILLPYFSMKKMYPSARENMLVIVAGDGMVPQAMDEVHRRADARGVPEHDDHHGAGDGDSELHRAAGGRRRSDEYHAGLGDRAHPRDRRAEGGRRPPQRHRRPVSYRSRGAHRRGRVAGNHAGLAAFAHRQAGLP
jgi:putative ABC transport system permease protein